MISALHVFIDGSSYSRYTGGKLFSGIAFPEVTHIDNTLYLKQKQGLANIDFLTLRSAYFQTPLGANRVGS